MGSVHSKISGSASSRPRGWQHMLPPPLAPDVAQRAAAPHFRLARTPCSSFRTPEARMAPEYCFVVGPEPSKNCENDLAVNSTGIGLVFN